MRVRISVSAFVGGADMAGVLDAASWGLPFTRMPRWRATDSAALGNAIVVDATAHARNGAGAGGRCAHATAADA